LPNELVQCILDRADGLTLPVLRCVCWPWYHLVESMCVPHGLTLRRRKNKHGIPMGTPTSKHECDTSGTECIVRYVMSLIRGHRWDLFEWVITSCGRGDVRKTTERIDHLACSRSAAQGDLVRLQQLRQRGFRWGEGVCDEAAMYGHLHVIEWALANGCAQSGSMCARAIKNGHLHVLEWADAHACVSVWGRATLMAAAKGGLVDVLQRAHSKGVTSGLISNLCESAARGGRRPVLEWVRREGFVWNELACSAAAKGGHLELLQWLRANGCRWDFMTPSYAARRGHYDILKWAHDNGCKSRCTSTYIARTGNLEMLQWAMIKGHPWHAIACANAARGGHLDAIKWMRKHGCPWDGRVYKEAAYDGHAHVIKWAWTNGCPYAGEDISFLVKHCGAGLIGWLLDNGLDWHRDICARAFEQSRFDLFVWARDTIGIDTPLCTWAAHKGNLMVLQWATAKGFPWSPETLMWAVTGGHLRIIEWALANGCPVDGGLCSWAAAHGQEGVVALLQDRFGPRLLCD